MKGGKGPSENLEDCEVWHKRAPQEPDEFIEKWVESSRGKASSCGKQKLTVTAIEWRRTWKARSERKGKMSYNNQSGEGEPQEGPAKSLWVGSAPNSFCIAFKTESYE